MCKDYNQSNIPKESILGTNRPSGNFQGACSFLCLKE